ncbi:MAG TPA: hypothetical protein VF794_23905 [Archangium sp.]|uniref:hypothetical protein n=1 Tax=Archangium sp. TaxID=1872627 RepID=UPI002ED86739
MRTGKFVGVSVVGALLLSTGALAGAKATSEVVINTTSNAPTVTAMGSMGSARNSADATQYIGCQLSTNNVSSGSVTVVCFAKNAAGQYVSCVTTDPNYVNVAQSIQSDSYIRFNYDSSVGSTCTYLLVVQNSYYAPKQP